MAAVMRAASPPNTAPSVHRGGRQRGVVDRWRREDWPSTPTTDPASLGADIGADVPAGNAAQQPQDRPASMTAGVTVTALPCGPGVGAASPADAYVALGGGSYHWRANTADGRTFFLTVDDLQASADSRLGQGRRTRPHKFTPHCRSRRSSS
jgi:hypothetical protein